MYSGRTLAEAVQGRLVAACNARCDALQRLELLSLISVQREWSVGNRRVVVRLTKIHKGIPIAESPDDNTFPTEALMARVALGLAVHGVSIQEPLNAQREKSENAKRVANWSTATHEA